MKSLKKITILFCILIGLSFIILNVSNATDDTDVIATGECGTSITWTLNKNR